MKNIFEYIFYFKCDIDKNKQKLVHYLYAQTILFIYVHE